jgi:tetratricopeptide (TPR) repeat protein
MQRASNSIVRTTPQPAPTAGTQHSDTQLQPGRRAGVFFTLLLISVVHASPIPENDWTRANSQGLEAQRGGRYAEAASHFAAAVEAAGNDAERRAKAEMNLAAVVYYQGDYATAERLYRGLASFWETQDRPSERAKTLSNLAVLYRVTGRLDKAEALQRQVLTIYSKAGRARSQEAITTAYNLSETLRAQGRFQASLAQNSEVLAQAVEELGPESETVANLFQSQAALYRESGAAPRAEEPQRQALAIFRKLHGERHPTVASAANNLGQVLLALRRHAEAEALTQSALKDYEATLGPNHNLVAVALNNLGQIYRIRGRLAEAEPLYRRAVEIWEQSLGPDHPNVARGMKNLGDLFAQQGKYRGAEALYDRALRISERSLGADHPEIATILAGLSGLYRAQQRATEAGRIERRLARFTAQR